MAPRLALTAAVAVLAASGSVRAQAEEDTIRAVPSLQDKTAGMEPMAGYFPLYWEKATGRLWMEVSRFDTELLYVKGIAAGLGSNDIGIDRGQLTTSQIVRFQRVGPKVFMVQPNYRFRASSDDAHEGKAVEEAFAQSVLWGFTVAAETAGRVLVDMTPFLLRDSHGLAQRLRPGTYGLDESRSSVYLPMTLGFPKNTEMEAMLTFSRKAEAQVPAPGNIPGPPGSSRGPFEGVGNVAASPEAATLRVHHSLVELPDASYTPRRADPRAGYGVVTYQDPTAPLGEPMTRRFVRRHRLEKVDPGAEMSDPVKPIVYYLDPGIPLPVRSAVLDGARWWNQAFEAAGYRNAFQVKILPAEVSSHDVRYNVINWVHRSTRGWSYGNSVTDPRTGEIIKGVVTLGSLRVRQDYLIAEGLLSPYPTGTETPPELADWALARIRQLAAHEVGHTLGLGHNYYDSSLGQISVLDYPHPWVTLREDGTLDYSQVYGVGIGEWDKVAITYGYQHFPPGTDEEKALAAILDTAWERDLRFMTGQDTGVHPKVDQWSNGTDPGAELRRMMEVRRMALRRFGEEAIQRGRPLATLEEVLVPLYLHHRYQLTAAASVLGGLHYVYALRGDGREPVRPVPAGDQWAALEALLETLHPAELALPRALLPRLPPRPSGWGRHRELFPRYTGPAFDSITPAVVAARHTVAEILDPQRAARLVEQHALDANLPGLDGVIERLLAATFEVKPGNGYEAEIKRAVERVVIEELVLLARNAPMPQVRALAGLALHRLDGRVDRESLSLADRAHYSLLDRDIQRFLHRPAPPFQQPAPQTIPPGAPIGQPAMEWMAPWVLPSCSAWPLE